MRWNTFGRSVGFAAAAAPGTIAWLLCVAPVLGARRAFALWLVGLTTAYVGGLAADLHRRLGAAVVTAAVGAGLLLLAPGNRELALALAVVLAVARSLFLQPGRAVRSVVVEALLVVGGLTTAAAICPPSLRGAALAVWTFFLVQSFFFLIPRGRPRDGRRAARDPFAAAYARATALLDGHPTR